MKTVYIHMGTHKTGSSALQVFFARNVQALKTEGVYYPAGDTHRAATQFIITSGNAEKLSQYFAGRPGGSLALPNLKSDIKAAAGRHILYSSETFNTLSPAKVKTFLKATKQSGYRVQCLFFVRSPVGYALSQYSQLVKRHLYKQTFAHYLENGFELPFETIRTARDLFGAENLRIENYDLHRNNLPAFFVETVLCLAMAKFEVIEDTVNRSLTPFELEFMRSCNVLGQNADVSTYISDALIYGQTDVGNVQKISKEHLRVIQKVCAVSLNYINSLGVDPPVVMKDKSIKIGTIKDFKLNPFQRATLSVFMKLVADQQAR